MALLALLRLGRCSDALPGSGKATVQHWEEYVRMTSTFILKARYALAALCVLTVMLLGLVIGALPVLAQDEDPVPKGRRIQELTGYVEPEGGVFYLIPALKQGETLYVYAIGTSGNLDPFLGLSDVRLDGAALRDSFWGRVEEIVASGEDPLEAQPLLYSGFFPAWDDDSGAGYDAALAYEIPDDGDYQLLITRSPTGESFGAYRLLVGIDAPEVLTGELLAGEVELAGEEFVVLDLEASAARVFVQEIVDETT